MSDHKKVTNSNHVFCSHDFYLFVWSLIWWCLRRPLMQVSPRPGPPASSTSYSARVILCCRISARGAVCTLFKNSTTWIQNLWALHFWYQVATPFRLFGKFTERQKRKFRWGPDDLRLIHNDGRWFWTPINLLSVCSLSNCWNTIQVSGCSGGEPLSCDYQQ